MKNTMTYMSLENIASVCGGKYFGDGALCRTEVTGVVTDSRMLRPGDLFVALRGERVDGHSFIPEVFDKGAAAVLSEEKLISSAGPYILVSSCLKALKNMAEFYRRTLSLPVVGIAGSVGKTGTKEMVAAVLGRKYRVLKTEGNFNNEIGLPLTLLGIRPEHEAAVVEMGISDFGEMHRLAKMARPDICVLTNIEPCHLEKLGDLDGVLRAKSEMFDFLGPGGVIILNGNDDKLSEIDEPGGIRPVRYFVCERDEEEVPGGQEYFVLADSVVNRGLYGMEAVLHFQDGDCPVTEPIPGVHNIYNACAAACVGAALGLSREQISAGIASVKTLPGRTNVIRKDELVIIDDCYNASPGAMRESLDILAGAEGRRIAVLGDMLELGEAGRALHREIGAYAAGLPIDAVYCTGELARELADAAETESRAAKTEKRRAKAGGLKRPGMDIKYFETKEELTERLLRKKKKGDVILVKASHSMGFSGIVEALKKP